MRLLRLANGCHGIVSHSQNLKQVVANLTLDNRQ
jgi:hypothetical protein